MTRDDVLAVWVVYDHPRDAPEWFVVRQQWVGADGLLRADLSSYRFADLDVARAWLASQGLTCLTRHPDDDPVILETWL